MRWIFAAVLIVIASSAQACGRDSDCAVASGTYRIALPDGEPRGTIVFFHGWQGTAAGFMRGSIVRRATAMGLAVIAPQGAGKSWSFPGSPSQRRDDFGFVEEVLADAGARFGLDAARMMASGFSLGGSMVWSLACHRGDLFAGFAPVAGAYWEPLPESCPSKTPVLLHTHGIADRTVPMVGRPIGRNSRQGDVRESIALWLGQGRCGAQSTTERSGLLTCKRWSNCDGGVIELCLHDGGHSLRSDWVIRGWEELAQIKGWE